MGFTYIVSGRGWSKRERESPRGRGHSGVVAGDRFRRRGIRLDGELGISTVLGEYYACAMHMLHV